MIPRLTSDSPRLVLIAGSFLFVVLIMVAATAMEALSLNRYDAPGSESVQAREVLAEAFGTGSPNIAMLVRPASGSVDDPRAASAGAALTEALASQPGIGDAWSYWSAGAPETLAAEDGSSALILAWAPGDADHVRGEVLPLLQTELVDSSTDPAIEVTLGGSDEIFRVVAAQARTDFLRAELIILPVVVALLWLVFRRLRLALVTTAVGLFSVAGTLAILRLVSLFTDVSTFASNIALVMGIGLGVDYGLFMTFRFREELRSGSDAAAATRAAMRAAGRTIVFSGATVAASLAVLFVFPFPFLSSFAYAGIGVVLTAVFASTILLPAALRVLGRRALPRRERPLPAAGFWERLAAAVMRRPVIAGSLGLVVLLGLGAPALGAQFGSPDDRILPAGQSVRDMYDTIRADYRAEDADAVYVVAPGAAGEDVSDYAASLSRIEGVERVDSAAGAFVDGRRTGDAARGGPDRYQDADSTWLAVLPTSERLAAEPIGFVDDIRGEPAPFETLVGGYPAELADYRAGVGERLPLVAGLILLVTFIVLFLMTGSVIAPLKASVLNLLSLSVMFGVLVWGFQDGGLAWLLGFTPTGVIEPSIPLLMFCVAYGLSMDYEVFLLARIKEDFDRTGDPIGSVARGIGRSAPLVSAAAGILAVSFLVYTTSEVSFLQQLGVGMALAVLVDATVIRGVLVPAFMRLAGRANWWAPAPLRRLHRRIGWHESAGAAPPTSAFEPEPVR
ncbi:MMPL family transporter [Microbacterium sp. CFH 90308]|uniref:MMPL family transporter n=1 Tax=Microbacterium salsuginis TaxID=2722803 RepID=A0ABX1KAK0_9MICO|nr:MMPL family transporter [Microbacterium sp. CFH 90308]NLP83512.1 MMPL family transporter [Microbacterium sp. CFH 90308]